jgi:hypothetical protein
MTSDERIEFLIQLRKSVESRDRQIEELTLSVARLVEVSNQNAAVVRTLASAILAQ